DTAKNLDERFRAPVRKVGVSTERFASAREKVLERASSLFLGDLTSVGGGDSRNPNPGAKHALSRSWIGRRKRAYLAEDALLACGKEAWLAAGKPQSRLVIWRLAVATPEHAADESHQPRAIREMLFRIERAVPLKTRSFSTPETSRP